MSEIKRVQLNTDKSQVLYSRCESSAAQKEVGTPRCLWLWEQKKAQTSHKPVPWSYWGKETPFGTWCEFILKQTSLLHFCLKYRTQYNFDESEKSQRNTKVRKWPGEMGRREKFSALVSFIWGNSKQGGDATSSNIQIC